MLSFSNKFNVLVGSNFVVGSKEKVVFFIVVVRVKGEGFNNYMEIYVLIDFGGTSGYCLEEFV